MLRFRVTCLVVLIFAPVGFGQELIKGSRVRLVTRDAQIPGHHEVGQGGVQLRIPSATEALVLQVDPVKTHWVEIQWEQDGGADETAWITSRYVDVVLSQPGGGEVGGGASSYVVGCWNLEHFGYGKSRGFPENTFGGPTIPARENKEDLRDIATVINSHLRAKLLVLNEVNGVSCADEDEEPCAVSHEIEDLLTLLSGSWEYTIGYSGGSQRVVIIYDGSCVRLNEVIEIDVPSIRVGGKDIFARDPLVAYTSFLEGGEVRNDFIVCGLHLASGQFRVKNHDAAMDTLRRELVELQSKGFLGGEKERDIIVMGDLNANAFDTDREDFFDSMDEVPWNVLADDGYPATRLSGNPLRQRSSIIDYIIVHAMTGAEQEIAVDEATVHDGLIQAFGGSAGFRARLSDHLPVTISVIVRSDDD